MTREYETTLLLKLWELKQVCFRWFFQDTGKCLARISAFELNSNWFLRTFNNGGVYCIAANVAENFNWFTGKLTFLGAKIR